ncbi:hypothetical protein L9F63_022373, partial [Diploptera punctata]
TVWSQLTFTNTVPINASRGWTRPKMGSVFLALLLAVIGGTLANPEAKRLYDDLLSNYNRLIRPVGNNSDRLTVKMGLRLSQLIDVVMNLRVHTKWVKDANSCRLKKTSR